MKNNKVDYRLLNGTAETQLLSKSMHKILFKIKDKSKVAKSLLRLNRHGYSKDSTRNVHIRKDKEMSYCPSGRETVLKADPQYWDTTNRQQGKYGKILKKLISEQVPNLGYNEKDIEVLVNHIKSELHEGTFKIVSGDDIAYWYTGNKIIEGDSSSLSGSCMNDSDSSFFDIYCNNPDVVKMVVLVKDDRLVGRALLWNDKWMDRVYGRDHIIKMFLDYAKESGYNHKQVQSYSDKTGWVSPSGENFQKDIKIHLDTDFDYFPYIDTFSYGNDGWLSNNSSSKYIYEYQTTGGYRDDSEDNRQWDDIDECYIDNDDAVYIESRGETTHIDNTVYDDYSGDYILSGDAIYVESSNQYVHQDDLSEHNIVECDNGNYYDLDDTFMCEYDDTCYNSDQNDCETVEIDGDEFTVHVDKVEDFYKERGYEQNSDDEWVKTEE